MSAAVTSPIALNTAYSRLSHTSSWYLYFDKYFSFENTSWTVFRSGEHTGRKTSSIPKSFRKLRCALSAWPWCAARLSTTTMSPTSRIGVCVIGSTVAKRHQRIVKTVQSLTFLLWCFHILLHHTQLESSGWGLRWTSIFALLRNLQRQMRHQSFCDRHQSVKTLPHRKT